MNLELVASASGRGVAVEELSEEGIAFKGAAVISSRPILKEDAHPDANIAKRNIKT